MRMVDAMPEIQNGFFNKELSLMLIGNLIFVMFEIAFLAKIDLLGGAIMSGNDILATLADDFLH
jgi:hypothetical protein